MIRPAGHRNVMEAAGLMQTSTPREAAILGGIVRSTLDTGRIDPAFVGRYTSEILRSFNLVNVDDRPPSGTEIEMVMSRFKECYGRTSSS